MTTFSETLIPRRDLSRDQKWLLCYLKSKALDADGTLSITVYQLEHDFNLTGMNVLHNLVVLQLTHDLIFTITKTSHGPVCDLQLRGSRQAVNAL